MSLSIALVIVALVAVVAIVLLARVAPVRNILVRVPGLKALVQLGEGTTARARDRRGRHKGSDLRVTGRAQLDMDHTKTEDTTIYVEGTPIPNPEQETR